MTLCSAVFVTPKEPNSEQWVEISFLFLSLPAKRGKLPYAVSKILSEMLKVVFQIHSTGLPGCAWLLQIGSSGAKRHFSDFSFESVKQLILTRMCKNYSVCARD